MVKATWTLVITAVLVVAGVLAAEAQKDRMDLGERLGAQVIRSVPVAPPGGSVSAPSPAQPSTAAPIPSEGVDPAERLRARVGKGS